MTKISVVGSGHGGSAAAAALSSKGHNVSILKLGNQLHNDHFETLSKTKKLKLTGILGEHIVDVNISRDPSRVISDADILLIFYVANFQLMIAEKIAPYLRSGQIIYVCPGYLGSVFIMKELNKLKSAARPLLIEGETLPFTSRIIEPGHVSISSLNVVHPIAVTPKARINEGIQIISSLFGKAEEREQLIEVALHNPNLIIHTIGTLMNISRVEDPIKNFAMYRDGFSPSMWKLVNCLDREKQSVLQVLGCQPRSYFDEFELRTFGNVSATDPMEGFKHYAGEAPGGPYSLNNRYLTEDVPIGLGLLTSVADELGIDTPVADALILLTTIVLESVTGNQIRSAPKMGFNNYSEMMEFIEGWG